MPWAVAHPLGVPELWLCLGRVGAVPLLPPQLGQLLAAVSLLGDFMEVF